MSERPMEMRRFEMPVGEEKRVDRRVCVALEAKLSGDEGVAGGFWKCLGAPGRW